MAKKGATRAIAAADAPGACLVTDPITGVQTTLFLTQSQCSARGGKFTPGPVGPGLALDIAAPKKAAVKKAKKASPKKSKKKKGKK